MKVNLQTHYSSALKRQRQNLSKVRFKVITGNIQKAQISSNYLHYSHLLYILQSYSSFERRS